MRQFEDRLRAELRLDWKPTITKETMLARVARARRRRSVAAGAGAVAVCALALTIVVPMLSRAAGGGGDSAATTPRLIHEGRLLNVVFTSWSDGYALQERCSMPHPDDIVNPNPKETPDVRSRCEAKLLVTSDSGVSWQERTLPAEPAQKDAGVDLLPGHSMMLWSPVTDTVAVGGRDRRYWTTTDGGVTWQEAPTPYPVPSGFGVLGLDDRHAFLASAPGGVGEKNPIVAGRDASYWVTCWKTPCLLVTRDQGQNWQTVELPSAGTGADFVATVDGQTVYASVSSTEANSTLFRSHDSGATWQPVPGLTIPSGSRPASPCPTAT